MLLEHTSRDCIFVGDHALQQFITYVPVRQHTAAALVKTLPIHA